MTSGGTLTKTLLALTNSDFITSYVPLDKRKETYYKLSDNFCLFYLNFIEKKGANDEAFWQHSALSPAISAWQGFAFEEVCFAHSRQIKVALGIAGIQTNISSLIIAKDEQHSGMQIDMLIDRTDRVINLCEIKYCNQEFVIDKKYEEKLRSRVERIREWPAHLTACECARIAVVRYRALQT